MQEVESIDCFKTYKSGPRYEYVSQILVGIAKRMT